jgi:hypothetical protein
MRTLTVLLAAGAIGTTAPAHAASPGVYWDCTSVQARPVSVDLNCQRADATLTSLRWKGRTARGSFNFPSYSADGNGLVTLAARVTASRPRAVGGTTAFTRLAVKLYGSKRDREGLSRTMRYVITCDLGQGWVPSAVAKPC